MTVLAFSRPVGAGPLGNKSPTESNVSRYEPQWAPQRAPLA
jgi:hypothetical protein